MNLSKFGYIFIVIIICAFMPLAWSIHASSVAARNSQKTQDKMVNAAYDAMQSVNVMDDYAFKTKSQRSEALDAFYVSLASAYGLTAAGGISEAYITSHIPFVALIDTDGVYVAYSKDYNTWGNADSTTYKVSPITTFAETYTVSATEQYTIQFKLDNTASVYYNGSKLAEGNFKDLKKALTKIKKDKKEGMNAVDILKFMKDKTAFDDEKQAVITNVVVRTVQNYMNNEIATSDKKNNNNMTGYNLHNTQYQIVIPRDKQADFANALTSPTVISFYQGNQIQTGTSYVMTFALAGGEMSKTQHYFISEKGGTKYYHSTTTCLDFRARLGAKDPDSGLYISEQKYYTMEEAARSGAYPCVDCVH